MCEDLYTAQCTTLGTLSLAKVCVNHQQLLAGCGYIQIRFALAALAATGAFAQSSVTIKGTFDPSVANTSTTYANGASVSNTFVRNNSQGTSQITFLGTEDLGGGLKASFLLENDFDTRFDANGQDGVSATGTRGVNLGSGGGEQWLGLSGGFGNIQIGSANTPSLSVQGSRQPYGTKIGSGFNSVLGTGHVRSNNSVVYTAPTFAGLTVSAAYGFQNNAANTPATGAVEMATTNTGAPSTVGKNDANSASITDIGLMYANGPLAAGVSFWNTAAVQGTTTPAASQTNLFASYDLGVAKLIAGYHAEKQDAYISSARPAGIDANSYNIAATVPLNAALTLSANFGKLTDNLAARAATPLNKSIAAVGVKFELSKRTSVYARYVSETNDNTDTAFAASVTGSTATLANSTASIKTSLVGIQHNF